MRKSGDWSVIKRALANGWAYKWMIALTLACNAAAAVLFTRLLTSFEGLMRAVGAAANATQAGTSDPAIANSFYAIAREMLLLAVPAGIAAYGAWWCGQKVANLTMRDLRNRTLAHLVNQELNFHHQLSRGDLLTRLTNDLSQMLRLQQLVYGKFLQKPVMALGATVALFVIDWRLAVGICVVLAPAGLIIWPILARTRDRSARARESLERNFGVLEQITAGIKVIKAMGSAEREVTRYAHSNDELVKANMRLARTRAQSDGITYAAIFLLAGGGMAMCGWLYAHGQVDPATLLTFLLMLGVLINNLRETQRGWSDLQEQIPSAERVYLLLDRVSAIPDDPAAPAAPAPRQAIRLEGVRFAYAADAGEVLRGIDLEIVVGRTTALVGRSGGGKSTLLDLLPRFHDVTGGRITWDKTDLRSLRLSTIAPHVAIVGQEPFLFDDTLRANIAFGRPDADQAAIEQAARRANLHDDVLRLEGGLGYDTPVGDRGGRLSGGQRQRVAIARALLRDAPILLLDEPTSALDAQSEQYVQSALAELMKGRTVVVVAHRLATVQHADRIYVLAGKDDAEPGTVLESGTHAELIARGGTYADMVRLQRLD